MLHDQMINFLETTIIFLLLTNAVSGLAAAYAISLAHKGRPALAAATRRPNSLLSAGSSRER
jgi:hypothetical protein